MVESNTQPYQLHTPEKQKEILQEESYQDQIFEGIIIQDREREDRYSDFSMQQTRISTKKKKRLQKCIWTCSCNMQYQTQTSLRDLKHESFRRKL